MPHGCPSLHAMVLGAVLIALPAVAQPRDGTEAVAEVLDALHQAASDADYDRYFSLYAREAVFLGTDATERLERPAFMAYAKARFDTGTGWTYRILERHIAVVTDGQTAWFDERLENADLGETRGSGVLVIEDGGWKIAHYNLTIPIPNELSRDIVRQIRDRGAAR